MHAARRNPLLLGVGVVGIAFVSSCGDNLHLGAEATIDAPEVTDAPQVTDAAPACDCPAAESPLAGRFVLVSAPQIIAPNTNSAQGVRCPEGATLISGSCTTDALNSTRNTTMEQTGFFFAMPPGAWNCMFRNHEATPVTIRVSLICLKPAP